MSKKPNRTRITAPKTAAVKISIRPLTREKNGSVWLEQWRLIGCDGHRHAATSLPITGHCRGAIQATNLTMVDKKLNNGIFYQP
jgi:hypothetical protein